MRKILSALILINISLIPILGIGIITVKNNMAAAQTSANVVSVFVNSTIYDNITNELTQYETDLQAQGYTVIFHN
ncbi:MAG: hypothetical protein ACTSQY_11500, partial [Candidatus Odinarchaeia archaeon]